MVVTIRHFDDTQIIHLSIAIQVKIGEGRIRIIEHLLEVLQVLGLSEERSHRLEIKVLGDIG